MAKITNAVLAEKIDGIQKTLDDDIKPGIKANTEFRLQAKGMMTIIAGITAAIAGGIIWLFTKIFGGK